MSEVDTDINNLPRLLRKLMEFSRETHTGPADTGALAILAGAATVGFSMGNSDKVVELLTLLLTRGLELGIDMRADFEEGNVRPGVANPRSPGAI